ncbi:MAG: cytochrome P450 [Pseudomonadota bacterium]
MGDRFTPPHPAMLPPLLALARTVRHGDGDLLSLLPAAAYRMKSGTLGYSRRSIVLFNDPAMVREIMLDKGEAFPKSDLMVGALEPLIGDSIFVSDGEKWRPQRAMIDPAFSYMRLTVAYEAMTAAVDDYQAHLEAAADSGKPISLDLAMGQLTADIICRTVFSVSLASHMARDVFDDFLIFERGVAQVKVWRLITDKAWAKIDQDPAVLAACTRIRHHLGQLIDHHQQTSSANTKQDGANGDIAAAVMAARDPENGAAFTREELIDQLGVFFLAGHETTASVLTWVFYILSIRPDILRRVRAEVSDVVGTGPITFDDTKKMIFIRAVFRETLRLYPPITFMPRIALRDVEIGGRKLRKGALVMIAPWTLHRHADHWTDPHVFDADRFMPAREGDIPAGAYMPFGFGPHTCVGAGFALVEAILIIAQLARAYDFTVHAPENVRPAARLTTRPADQIMVTVKPAHA